MKMSIKGLMLLGLLTAATGYSFEKPETPDIDKESQDLEKIFNHEHLAGSDIDNEVKAITKKLEKIQARAKAQSKTKLNSLINNLKEILSQIKNEVHKLQ